MCDIYDAKCERCEARVNMHIKDFDYPRKDIKAWCDKHMPGIEGIEIFVIPESDGGGQVGIMLQDGKLKPSDKGVHPNI